MMEESKRKGNTKILILGFLCLIGIIGIVGYTYSFFAVNTTNDTSITGTAASLSLTVTVTKESPTTVTGGLIPQLDAYITSAVTGKNGSCVDDNNNPVCEVYKIVVKNNSGVSVVVDGKIELDAKDNPNLKWAQISGLTEPTLVGNVNSHYATGLIRKESYTGNEEKTYYIVVWISETGLGQTDTGIFSGVVNINETDVHSLAYQTLESLNLTDDIKVGQTTFEDISPLILTYKETTSTSSTYSLNTTRSQYYVTYADSYAFDTQTGTYSLVNPKVAQYPNIYSDLVDKYIVYPSLSSSSSIASYTNLSSIYQVSSATYDSSTKKGTIGYQTLKYVGDTFDYSDTGIFATEDDLGTSYYFRGAVENNYVKFGKYTEDAYRVYDSSTGITTYVSTCTAEGTVTCEQIASANDDMYWRIVRINGDGTIRMIYAGTSAHQNGEKRESIGTVPYNKNYNDNAYIGYMYGSSGQSTYEATHANTNNSTIKIAIDAWYQKYLNTTYSNSIADSIYCNDRKVVTDDSKYKALWKDDTRTSGNGIGNSNTMYGTWARIEPDNNYSSGLTGIIPTLKCEQVNDRFTKNGSTITTLDGLGTNQDLTYPIGLLTADETVFAGGFWANNYSYYLYSDTWYWTMSPSFFSDGRTTAFFVGNDGYSPSNTSTPIPNGAVFPTISLASNAITGGLGTASNPFTVSLSTGQ